MLTEVKIGDISLSVWCCVKVTVTLLRTVFITYSILWQNSFIINKVNVSRCVLLHHHISPMPSVAGIPVYVNVDRHLLKNIVGTRSTWEISTWHRIGSPKPRSFCYICPGLQTSGAHWNGWDTGQLHHTHW
jgi:hypothetical protein